MKKQLAPGQWICLCLTALFLVLAVVTYLTDTLTSSASVFLIGKHKTGVGALNETTPVTQTFVGDQAGMSTVEVMVSTYNKKLKEGTLTLWLTAEGSDQELARQEYPVSELKNNAYVTLPLQSPQQGSAGRRYVLHATSNCTEQKGVTLRMGPITDPEHTGTLVLADATQDAENALNIRTVYQVSTYGWMAGMNCLLIGLCFAACIPLTGRKERTHA